MTNGFITTDIELAKHGCENWSEVTAAEFREVYAGKRIQIVGTKDPNPEIWKCGTDIVFKVLYNGEKAALCRHQITGIGD